MKAQVTLTNVEWRLGSLVVDSWQQAWHGGPQMAALPRLMLLVDGHGRGYVAEVLGPRAEWRVGIVMTGKEGER